jgi:hypothetical protein
MADEIPFDDPLDALLAEPFPKEPYALVPEGGDHGPGDTEYVIHKDIDTERQCVLLFDSVVDAFAVAEEFQKAVGRAAEPVPCPIRSLEDRFWVKFYRANGAVAILSLDDYKRYIDPIPEE